MRLRTKTLVTTGGAFLVLLAITVLVSNAILLESFRRLEEEHARENGLRVERAVLRNLEALDDLTFDWASFDDTYEFIVDRNAEYIRVNLLNESFTTIRVNDMIFLDLDGRVVFEKSVDLDGGTEVPVPEGLHAHLVSTSPLLQLPATSSAVHGIVSLPDGPVLVAARPIITSDEQGPIRGSLIMARRLDERLLGRFASDTRLELIAHDPEGGGPFAEPRSTADEPDPATTTLRRLSTDSLSVYTTLRDLYGDPALVVETKLERGLYRTGRSAVWYFIAAFLVAGGLVTALLVALLDRAILSRLIRMGKVLNEVSPGNSQRVDESGADEVADLGRTMNRMLQAMERHQEELSSAAGSLETTVEIRTRELEAANRSLSTELVMRKRFEKQAELIEKLESLGVLAAGIAHDFNNLLVGIMGNLSLAQNRLGKGSEEGQWLDQAVSAAQRARGLTRQLLTFSKGGAPIRAAASLPDILRDTAEFCLCGSQVRVKLELGENLWPVEVDRDQVSNVINNLLLNAKEAMPSGGSVRILANNEDIPNENLLGLPEGRYVRVAVADDGPGIDEASLGRVFEPYFTTKKDGSGLGLTASWSIIRRHGGSLTVESKVGDGTAFHIHVPASQHSEPSERKAVRERQHHRGSVLVMDDDERVLQVAIAMLEQLGFRADSVRDGRELIASYREALAAGTRYDVVILDLTVPGGLGGEETLELLLAIDPDARAVVSSGYSEDAILADFRRRGFRGALPKPYLLDELSNVLTDLLDPAEGR